MFNLSSIRLDAKGRALTGERRYTFTFKPPIFAEPTILNGFWSVTMYDGIIKLAVQNPINRYSLGSDNDLKKNPDGSFTMYLQADTPGPDKEANWLPAPKGPFYLLLRHYEHPSPLWVISEHTDKERLDREAFEEVLAAESLAQLDLKGRFE